MRAVSVEQNNRNLDYTFQIADRERTMNSYNNV